MPQDSSQFITCPKCNGLGKTDQGLVCNECGGISLGTFIKNDFLYWGYDLTPAKIILRHSKIFFNYFIISACFLLGLGGIFSLIWWIKNNALVNGYQINIGILLSFWGEQDGLILFFWAGILCLLFVYFFYHRLHSKNTKVKKLNYYEQEKLKQAEQQMPNNWQELRNFKVKIDVSQSYENNLLKAIEDAYELAINRQHQEFLPIHIVAVLLAEQNKKKKNESVQQLNFILKRLGIFKGKIEPKVQKILEKIPVAKEKNIIPVISRELRQGLIEAYLSAFDAQQEQVGLPNLISYLITNNQENGLAGIFNELQVDLDKIEMVAVWSIMHDHFYQEKKLKENAFWQKMQQKMQTSTTAVATPLLNYFCTNITQKIKFNSDGIIVDNEDVLDQIFNYFKEGKKQVVIKGVQGSGKTSVLANLAERIINNEVPHAFKDVQLLQLNLRKFLTEAPELTLEKKMLGLVAEFKHAYRAVLVIDNVPPEVISLLRQYQGAFSYIITVNQSVSLDAPIIDMSTLSEEVLMQILISRALLLEKRYKVYFDYDSLDLTVEAVRTHLADSALSSTAVNIFKQAAEQAAQTDYKIDKRLIAKIISTQTNVPFTKVLKDSN
ncbi:MAG: hypothetical protein ABIH48_03370 [Candidatus Falkowbacteria bacterium]